MKETKQGRMTEENGQQVESKGSDNHHVIPTMVNKILEKTTGP